MKNGVATEVVTLIWLLVFFLNWQV